MKPLVKIYIMMWIALFPVQAFAQGKPIDFSKKDSLLNPPLLEGQEVLRFDAKEVNVGNLSEDDAPVTYRFHFQNVSKKAVTVTKVNTSCGCTVATFSKVPVQPGEKGEVSLVFNPFQQAGKVNKHAFVYTDLSRSHPTAKIFLVGKVAPTANPLAADYPHSMGNALRVKRNDLYFREMPADGTRVERLVCINTGKQPLKLSASLIPRYAKFATEPEVIAPGQEADIVVTIDGHLLPPVSKTEFSFPIVIEGISAVPSDRTLHVKVFLQK